MATLLASAGISFRRQISKSSGGEAVQHAWRDVGGDNDGAERPARRGVGTVTKAAAAKA